MRVYEEAGIVHRAQLVKKLLEPVDYKDKVRGLEIGVWKGDMLVKLMEQIPNIEKLYGIDPWTICLTTCRFARRYGQKEWDAILLMVNEKIKNFPQVELVRGRSQDVVEQLPNDFHFIEIDGDHSYEQVVLDITLYEPKLVPGGLLCGHDYYGKGIRTVKPAVDDYAAKNGRVLSTIEEDIAMWWWYK